MALHHGVQHARLSLDERASLPTRAVMLVGHEPNWLRHHDVVAAVADLLTSFGEVDELLIDEDTGAAKASFRHLDRAVLACTQLADGAVHGMAFDASFAEEGPLTARSQFLQVPALTKQFLISPPASPPVGWEPVVEDAPVVNTHLVETLMGLEPNRPYEIHPATHATPAICVENCSSATELGKTAGDNEDSQTLSSLPMRPSIALNVADVDFDDLAAGGLAAAGLVHNHPASGERVMPQTRRPPLQARLHDFPMK